MRELGERLRKAREARGLSLEDVQDMTKIRLVYLEAIEAGDWSVLPGRFYAKMFVKTYAESLELPSDELLGMVRNELESKPDPKSGQSAVITGERPLWMQTIQRLAPAIAGWAVILLLLIGIYSWINSSDPDTVNEPVASPDRLSNLSQQQMEQAWDVATDAPAATAAPLPDSSGGLEVSAANDAEAGATNMTAPQGEALLAEPVSAVVSPLPEEGTVNQTVEGTGGYVFTGQGASEYADDAGIISSEDMGSGVEGYGLSDTLQVNVRLELTGDACWIEVREQSRRGEKWKLGKEVFVRGETIELHSAVPVYVKLGNPSAVRLSVNGQPIDTGTEQKPRTFGFRLATESYGSQ